MNTKTHGSSDVLAGVLVIDFTAMLAGPYCTRLMSDLGARVIKVEPLDGDLIRWRPPLREGKSAYFAQLNCGKQSLAIDLKSAAGRDIVMGLVAKADVVVENFRPGVMKRLGLDYEALSAINPRLVYCSISGFGQSGSWSSRSAYAPVVHAASGYDIATLDYQDDIERPLKNGIFVADILGGTQAFGGIQAALFKAARTGQGDHVDVSLLDSMLGLMVYETQEAQFPAERRRPLYQPTRASDGFLLIAPISQNNFEAMASAMGQADWITDPRFATGSAREQHWQTLMDLLDDWASSRSAEHCETILNQAGVPCSRYFTVREALQLPPVLERSAMQTVNDGAGPLKVTNPAFRYLHSQAHAREHLPALGADGPAILAELLGYDVARISVLVEHKTIRVDG